MRTQRTTGRPFAPTISSSGSSESSSVALTKWPRLCETKGVVYGCLMRSSAVCISTHSRCPLHPPSNRTPRFYTTLDKLPPQYRATKIRDGIQAAREDYHCPAASVSLLRICLMDQFSQLIDFPLTFPLAFFC